MKVRTIPKVFHLLSVTCLTLAVGQNSKCNSNLTHHTEVFIKPQDLFNTHLEKTAQMDLFSPLSIEQRLLLFLWT